MTTHVATDSRISELRTLAFTTTAVQDPTELWMTLVAFDSTDPRSILEVGVWDGGLTRTLRAAFPDAKLVGIEYTDHAPAEEEIDGFTLVRGDSHHLSVISVVRERGPYDCVVIDGDHSYHGVKADWTNYTPMLSGKGVVALHDINTHLEVIEVHRFLPEIDHHSHVDVVSGARTPGVRLVWNQALPRMDSSMGGDIPAHTPTATE